MKNYFVFLKNIARVLGVFGSIFFAYFGHCGAEAVDISTADSYGITSFMAHEYPEIDRIFLRELRPISTGYSVAFVSASRTEDVYNSIIYAFFLVNTSSGTLVKNITAFHETGLVDIKDVGKDYITVLQRMDCTGVEIARNTYFFDMDPASPIKKHDIQPVCISIIEPFGTSLFLVGTIGQKGTAGATGIVIKLGLQNNKIDLKKHEIITKIGGQTISPIVLAKVENGSLRMYAHETIYAFDGKNWTRTNEADKRYFRPKDPCASIPFDRLRNNMYAYDAGYKKCEKLKYLDGDAWMVGYEGKCESENSDSSNGLPHLYAGILERYAMPSHIIEISSAPLHRFFVWNNKATYWANKNHGIYEIADKKCRFYPLPAPTEEIIKSAYPQAYIDKLSNMMGPFQESEGRIWFCTDFASGEGTNGVGILGYFDTKKRKYETFYSSQTATWPCSALMVEKGRIWTGLGFGGQGDYGGRLAVLDTSTKDINVYKLPSGVNILHRIGDSIVIGSQDGIYVLSAEEKISFLGPRIDKNGNWKAGN